MSVRCTLDDMRKSGENGCLSCSLLFAAAHTFKDKWHIVGDEKDIRIFWMQRDPSLELDIVRLLVLNKTSSNSLNLEIFVDSGEKSPWPSISRKSFIPRDSGGEASLKQLNRWIETCRTQHKLCASYEQQLLPDRLIQVRSCTEPTR